MSKIEPDPEFVAGIAEVLSREGWRPLESCTPIAEKVAEHILSTAAEKLQINTSGGLSVPIEWGETRFQQSADVKPGAASDGDEGIPYYGD